MGPFRRFYKRQVAKRGTPAHLTVTGALSQPVLALSNCSRKGRFAMSSLTSWSPHVLSLLRVASGAAFMAHGTMKWLNFPTRSFPQPDVFSMTGASGAIALIVGALNVLGLFPRPAALDRKSTRLNSRH